MDPIDAGRPPADSGRHAVGAMRRRLAYVLLLGECVVILVPSVYGRGTPKLFGFPFFYWFQLAWIVVAMVVTGIAYLLTTPGELGTARRNPGAGR